MSSVTKPQAPPPASSEVILAPEVKNLLVAKALEASRWAYVPYSKYPVGAAILVDGTRADGSREDEAIPAGATRLSDGRIVFTGCNIENASYGLSICGERCTTFKAVSEGYQTFLAAAVVTRDGGIPCGACRQVLNEYGPKMHLILADMDGKVCHEADLPSLLPHSFGPANLLS